MICYYLKCNNKKGASDYEILDESHRTLIRIAKDLNNGGAPSEQKKMLLDNYCTKKYIGCKYAVVRSVATEPLGRL